MPSPANRALWWLVVAAVVFILPAHGREPSAVEITRLFSGTATAAGQAITLPTGPVQVVVSRYEIAPGRSLPVHRHPYPRYAYVESGTLRVTNRENGAVTEYHPGDFIVEMIGVWHSGEALGQVPVRLLVIDQTPPGTSNTVLRDPKPE